MQALVACCKKLAVAFWLSAWPVRAETLEVVQAEPHLHSDPRRHRAVIDDVKHQSATHKRECPQSEQAHLEHCRQRALGAATYLAVGWSRASA
eukprot:7381480-Prymnesium_polylepis.1